MNVSDKYLQQVLDICLEAKKDAPTYGLKDKLSKLIKNTKYYLEKEK